MDAITNELAVGPLVYRYTGAQREEQTFLACAYWRVGTLADLGRLEEAEDLMSQLDAVANPLGLLSEMAAAGSNDLIGNLPRPCPTSPSSEPPPASAPRRPDHRSQKG